MRREGRARSLTVVAVALLTAACGSPGDTGIVGLWSGPIERGGRTSHFGLRIDPHSSDSVAIHVSMPAIGAYDIPVGTGAFDGETLTFGSWNAAFDPASGTLTGSVPGALVPVYDIPVTLRRVDELPRTEAPEAAALVEPLWTHDAGAPVWAGLAAAPGVVVMATDAGTVHAVAEADGALAWEAEVGGPVRATPTIGDGGVYVHSDDGFVTLLDLDSGTPRWRARAGDGVERSRPGDPGARYDWFGSAVLLADGLAVVGTYGGEVVALDASSGEVRWRVDAGSGVFGTPSTDGTRIFYGTFDGDVVALDTDLGTEVWRTTTAGAVVSSPTVENGMLVIGNRAYDLLGLDAADGSTRWSFYYWFSWVESTATIVDGVAYVGSSDAQKLYAIESSTGRAQWIFPTEGSTWATPAVSDGVAYVGTVGVADYITDHQARVHAVDVESGAPLWRFEVSRPEGEPMWGFAASPAVGASAVYIGEISGLVRAFPAPRP